MKQQLHYVLKFQVTHLEVPGLLLHLRLLTPCSPGPQRKVFLGTNYKNCLMDMLWAWVAPGRLVHFSWPEFCGAGRSVALGLIRVAVWSSALGLCVGHVASAPSAHPPEVSGVGAPPWSEVWAASWGFSCGPPVR